jgi:excinuclease UvrABC nuclease subunit
MSRAVRAARQSWADMDSRPRICMAVLTSDQIPVDPGVYALYERSQRRYVGKARSLRQRVWGNHSGRGVSMTGSALRRNVAQHLKIASAADIKARRYQPTQVDADAIRRWLDKCDIAWIACANEADAVALEGDLKGEHMPPLTKI